jgi:hypothetical protein
MEKENKKIDSGCLGMSIWAMFVFGNAYWIYQKFIPGRGFIDNAFFAGLATFFVVLATLKFFVKD